MTKKIFIATISSTMLLAYLCTQPLAATSQSDNKLNLDANLIIQLPTIHIRRIETGSFQSNPLKQVRKMCILKIDTYKNTRDRFPEIWATEQQRIKKRQPDFNLDRGISPEPNWTNLTENFEDEYFSGNKYALYKIKSRYKISKDGSCKLIKSTLKTANIDDGQFQYRINFTKKTATKKHSAVAVQKEMMRCIKATIIQKWLS